jgi:hypothetical protein
VPGCCASSPAEIKRALWVSQAGMSQPSSTLCHENSFSLCCGGRTVQVDRLRTASTIIGTDIGCAFATDTPFCSSLQFQRTRGTRKLP